MRKIFLGMSFAAFLLSCNNDKEKTAAVSTTAPEKPAVELPYTASYSSSWSTDVSDADLKTVLMSYKDWETGNLSGLINAMGDTVSIDMSSGVHKLMPSAELSKMWTLYRDSLSAVRIDMQGWQKMYATDKKDGYVVTWYDEYDTFKDGKVDSASYHDINQIKDGKIIWYSQYKRPKK